MSGRASRAKGYRWEYDIVKFAESIFPTFRRNGNVRGPNDVGDFDGVDGWILEAKNRSPLRIGEWLRETAAKAKKYGYRWYALLVKQRGKGVEDGMFIMRIPDGLTLIWEHQQMSRFLEGKGYGPSDWANP